MARGPAGGADAIKGFLLGPIGALPSAADVIDQDLSLLLVYLEENAVTSDTVSVICNWGICEPYGTSGAGIPGQGI